MIVVAVGVAGALGAVCRYLVEQFVHGRGTGAFPLGAFVVNVSGAAALGALTGLSLHHGLPTADGTVVGTGFLGAYAAFSVLSFETLRLRKLGHSPAALSYALGSTLAGLAAATAGYALGSIH